MPTTPVLTIHDPKLAAVATAEQETALTGNQDVFNSSSTAAPHPEEMKLSLDLSFGRTVSIKAAIRTTPAGLAGAALLVSSILIPIVWLVRGRSEPGA